MSMLKWFRRTPVRRYFVVSFCSYREDGVEHGTMRIVTDGGSVPSKSSLRESLKVAKGDDNVVILATVEMANEADMDAYFSGQQLSEECHVRTLQ